MNEYVCLIYKKNKNRPVMDRCMYFIFIIRFKIDNNKKTTNTYIYLCFI